MWGRVNKGKWSISTVTTKKRARKAANKPQRLPISSTPAQESPNDLDMTGHKRECENSALAGVIDLLTDISSHLKATESARWLSCPGCWIWGPARPYSWVGGWPYALPLSVPNSAELPTACWHPLSFARSGNQGHSLNKVYCSVSLQLLVIAIILHVFSLVYYHHILDQFRLIN